MPLAEYRCPECGASFRTFELSEEDASGTLCPNCRAGELERVSSDEGASGCAPRGKRYR